MLNVIPGGNIFSIPCDVIVCPTNLKGAMGAGIAKQVRDETTGLYEEYRQRCFDGSHNLFSPYYNAHYGVLCLATKNDWREPSSLLLIQIAIDTFNRWLLTLEGNVTINLPLLGGGNGMFASNGYKKIKVSDYDKVHVKDLIIRGLMIGPNITVNLCV